MTPQLTQLTRYLDERGRLYRLHPVDALPFGERIIQLERIFERLHAVSAALGCDCGPRPTILYRGDGIAPPEDLLRHLTYLEIEILCTFLMCGLGDAHSRALFEVGITGINKPAPNFKIIVDDTYYTSAEDPFED